MRGTASNRLLHPELEPCVQREACFELYAISSSLKTFAKRTQHSEQYTYHTYDMLPHHRITCEDVAFFFTEF